MVEGTGPENSAAGMLEVFADGSLKLSGAFRQASYNLAKVAPAAK
jgi:hypothetical protein